MAEGFAGWNTSWTAANKMPNVNDVDLQLADQKKQTGQFDFDTGSVRF